MSMVPEVTYGDFYQVETNAGTEIVPAKLVGAQPDLESLQDYLEGKILEAEAEPIEKDKGYMVRLVMPGYLDSTPWVAFAAESTDDQRALKDVADFIVEQMDDDSIDGDERLLAVCQGRLPDALMDAVRERVRERAGQAAENGPSLSA